MGRWRTWTHEFVRRWDGLDDAPDDTPPSGLVRALCSARRRCCAFCSRRTCQTRHRAVTPRQPCVGRTPQRAAQYTWLDAHLVLAKSVAKQLGQSVRGSADKLEAALLVSHSPAWAQHEVEAAMRPPLRLAVLAVLAECVRHDQAA